MGRKLITTAIIIAAGLLALTACSDTLLDEVGDKIAADLAAADASVPKAEISISKTNLTTTEAGGSDSFSIALESQPTDNVTIQLSVTDTTEGSISDAEIVFTPENFSKIQTVEVTGVDDETADGDSSYAVTFDKIISADQRYAELAVPPLSAINIDDDVKGIVVSETSLFTTENGGSDTFELFLSSEPVSNVEINISSSNTSEGTVSPSTITFTPENYSTQQTVTVTGEDDALADGSIIYSINFDSIVSADPDYAEIVLSSVSVTNTDNDTKGITVTETSLTTTEASDGSPDDSFQVWLNSQPTANVTVSFAANDTTEGSVSPTSLTFTASNYASAQTVEAVGVNDSVDDGNISYSIIFNPVSSADSDYASISLSAISATNYDDDERGITVSKTSLTTTEASDGSPDDSFTVKLNSQPTSNVTIGFSSSDTGEGSLSVSSLTFTPSNYSTAQTVSLYGVNDYIDDGNQPFSITTSVSGGDYTGQVLPTISVVNVDNDSRGVVTSPSTSTSSRIGTTETGGHYDFTVRLNSQPTKSATINLSSSNTGAGGVINKSTIVFNDYDSDPDNNWNDPITVRVSGVDNTTSGYTDYQINMSCTSDDSNYNGISISPVYVRNAAETRTVGSPNVTPESTSSNRYSQTQTITIISGDAVNETIRYTTNGTTPTTTSAIYSGPFTVSGSNTTITAKAFYQDWASSGTDSEVYVIPFLRTHNKSTGISPTPGSIKYASSSNEVIVPCKSDGYVRRYNGTNLNSQGLYGSGISSPDEITVNSDALFIGRDASGYDPYEYWLTSNSKISTVSTTVTSLHGMDYYSGDLYLADDNSSNARIVIYDVGTDTYLRSYGPSGPSGGLASATGVTSCNGYIYVADYDNDRIARWRLSDHWYIDSPWPVTDPYDICSDENTSFYHDYVYILSPSQGKVTIYDATNNTSIDWFPVDTSARAITINESSNTLYIFHSTGYLERYSEN